MPRPARSARSSWIGQLGLQLTLAFVGVALAVVIAAVLIAALTVQVQARDLVRRQEADLARAVAAAAAAAYDHSGWAGANLNPIIGGVTHAGYSMAVRDQRGRTIEASPGFRAASASGPNLTESVVTSGRTVGSVTVAFGNGSIEQAVADFTIQRWLARIEAAAIAVAIAVLVAVPLSRLIVRPLDRLIEVARARTGGDLTARVGAVRGLSKLREVSAAFDRMADAGQQQEQIRRNLVADVAHELRTPIAVLQAGHEAMLDGFTEPAPDHLGSLRDEVLRLARMVDDLHRLASAEAAALQLTLVKCDLAAIVASAVASLADAFDAAGVTVVERLASVEVMSDPMRMHEVAVNLLTNALKFTPAGGRVTVESLRADDTARLRVADTGVGIPADELPRVAERFFRGQRSAGIAGSGIGMTIVAELVRAHNGSIDVASQPGSGTTVTVTLPLAGSAGSEPAMPAA